MHNKVKWACALLLSTTLSACTQLQYELGAPVAQHASDELQTGASLGQVLAALGPPIRISSSHNGYLMAWEYWQVSENSLGVSLSSVGADLLSIDGGKTRVAGEYLLATFDNNHRLSALSSTNWDDANGRGRAIQPSLGIADVVDVDDLIEDLPHHSWGEQLLNEPASALNAPHSPDSGANGIEQRGTPIGVGQRALDNL